MRIKSFQGITFPRQQETDDIPLKMKSALMSIPGADGSYDINGDNVYRDSLSFTRKFLLTGTAIHTELDELRAVTNTRGGLVFETRGSDIRWCWAKLTNVSYSNAVEQANYLPVTLSFEVAFPWLTDFDDAWCLDAGFEFDDGLYFDGNYSTRIGNGSLSIANTGGGPIQTGIIEIRGATTNPSIENETNGWSISYTGTIASGSTLLIDIGAQTAILNGVNVWGNITLGDNQTGIMRLEVGTNNIIFRSAGTLVWHWAKVY